MSLPFFVWRAFFTTGLFFRFFLRTYTLPRDSLRNTRRFICRIHALIRLFLAMVVRPFQPFPRARFFPPFPSSGVICHLCFADFESLYEVANTFLPDYHIFVSTENEPSRLSARFFLRLQMPYVHTLLPHSSLIAPFFPCATRRTLDSPTRIPGVHFLR